MFSLNFNPKPNTTEVKRMRSVCTFVAVVLLGLGPLFAADSARLIGVPHPVNVTNSLSAPDSLTLGFFATSVLVGQEDPNFLLPCFNCVGGAGVANIGVALPLVAVFSGAALTITLTGDDLFYDGPCSFTFNLVSGGTTVLTESVAGTCTPGVWLAEFPTTAPAAGHYMLQGIIATGHNFNSKSVVIGQLFVAGS